VYYKFYKLTSISDVNLQSSMTGVHMIVFWVMTSCRLRSWFLHFSEIPEETHLTWHSNTGNCYASVTFIKRIRAWAI